MEGLVEVGWGEGWAEVESSPLEGLEGAEVVGMAGPEAVAELQALKPQWTQFFALVGSGPPRTARRCCQSQYLPMC